ncbi:Glucosaminyl phosphatidylinositol (GlcN-PI) nositol acylation protein [Tulasnella sp. 424]|nr:Glucosaminyl phosphatidylinositol (GlcN-PI) nositol acylation protein [Tulasnella sp. 424]
MSSYKEAKEAFVSHTTGSSLTQILQISSVTVASLTLYFSLSTRLAPSSTTFNRPSNRFIIETTTLAVPILFALTISAERPLWLTLSALVGAFMLSFQPRYTTFISPKRRDSMRLPQTPTTPTSQIHIPILPLPSLTVYRANMMLLTVICILAVDFPVFPRMLAKCETWGASMMDLGVGSFVFSQGLVSAIPFLKDPSYASAPVGPKLMTTIKKTAPVLALGLVRVLLVKGTDYPEHVTEYGVHWNFFITLALLPMASVILHPYMLRMSIPVMGLLVTSAHEFLLHKTSLQRWALSEERIGILGMNKEGITSLPGYLAIHILGFAIGTLILPPSPSHFRRRQKAIKPDPEESSNAVYSSRKPFKLSSDRQLDKTVIELSAYTLMWWTLFGVVSMMSGGRMGVSRRLANLSYVLLTTAYNSLFLLCYMALELMFSPSPEPEPRSQAARKYQEHHRSDDVPAERPSNFPSSFVRRSSSIRTPEPEPETDNESGEYLQPKKPTQPPLQSPALFEAINRNGLPVFLLANVATGLINLSMQTMYMSDLSAMVVLILYVSGVCGVAWAFRGRRLLRL